MRIGWCSLVGFAVPRAGSPVDVRLARRMLPSSCMLRFAREQPMGAQRKTSSGSRQIEKPAPREQKGSRVVLFPTEASKIGRKKIEHAVERVTSKK
jgi:hypothetical protein